MTSEVVQVESEEHGLSLIQILKGRFCYSGKAIKRAIDANGCFINGRIERFGSSRVKQGDRIDLKIDRGSRLIDREFSLLYEDETLKAVYKNPFVSCDQTHQLHRLDRDTSGVLLQSRDPLYYEMFRQRKMEKTYIAVVEGRPKDDLKIIDLPIGIRKRYDGHKIMHVTEEGKEAITKVRLIKELGRLSVLMLFPKTGRTHQIRVHLASHGLPIIGDYDYGKSFSVQAPRMLLHAYQVRFVHPYTKKKTVIRAPLPEDMLTYITEAEIFSP